MTFLELAARRVSVRKYKPDPVPQEQLEQVLEAGRLAPSAKNCQPWHFIIVTEPERREAVCRAYARDWLASAPVILAVCVEPGVAWNRKDGKCYVDVDGAIAMDHMTLCATELGLGTCWIGAFDPVIAAESLELPRGVELLAMTPLGVPDDEGRPKKRKTMDELVHRERW